MKRKTPLAGLAALALLLLTTLVVAAQGGEPLLVTTTERVPIVVETGATPDTRIPDIETAETGLVTVTLIVTKTVAIQGNEVVSRSVSTQILLPDGAPVVVTQPVSPGLSVTVEPVEILVTRTAEEATPEANANRGANLRGGPGTNYPVVGGVRAGDALEIVAQNDDGTWYKLASGEWIAAFLVDNAPVDLPVAEAPVAPTPTPESTAATDAPSSDSSNAPSGPEQEIADATAAIARNPDDAEAYFRRAVAYYEQANYQKALDDINKVLALLPDEGVAYYLRGLLYHMLGNCPQAVQDFTQAISRLPQEADIYEARGVCYLTMENPGQALPDLEKVLELNPNHPRRAEIERVIQQIRQWL